MTINIEKCKVLHLGSNHPNHQYTMPMSGEAVQTLEVTIDEKDLVISISLLLDSHYPNLYQIRLGHF